VSARTLSSWECCHWLPPLKQRLHIVLAVRDAPPEHVLAIASALGVAADPAVAPFLKPFKDAIEDAKKDDEVVASPPPPPTRARSSPPRRPAELRATVDADRPRDGRRAWTRDRATCALPSRASSPRATRSVANLDEVHAATAPTPKVAKKAEGP